MTALLEVEEVTAGYGAGPVIRGVKLTVEAGEVVALLGPNGAGKTTTLRVISGLITPTGGRVLLDGVNVAGVSPTKLTRRGISHVLEGRGVFFGLTVAEHFRLERIDAGIAHQYFPALAALGNRRAGLLSGGEQQMLSVARALARRPRLLLLDELSLGLAPLVVERLLPVVRGYARDHGTGVLMVEQHVELALEIADRAYVLAHGELVLHRAVEDLRADRQLVVTGYLGEATAAPSDAAAVSSPERNQ